MIKTQVQIPDELYHKAKRVARERELSLAEVMRRGLEYITSVYPEVNGKEWTPPLIGAEGSEKISVGTVQKALAEDRDVRG
jgi:hypothetical protein